MKKRLRKGLSAMIAIMIMLCFSELMPIKTVRATNEKGSINVQVAPFAEGTELSLFEIGTCDRGFILNSDFSELYEHGLDITHLKDAHEMKEAADRLANYAYDFDIDPVAKARVDSEGVAKFYNVDADFKLYVIAQTSDTDTVAIGSFIVRMPYYTRVGGEYLYNLKVQTKYLDTRGKDKLGAVVLNKICPKGYPLKNAQFRFEQKMYYSNPKMIPENAETGEDRGGQYYWKQLARKMTTNDKGQIVVEDLPFGIYRFIETKAPYEWILDPTPIMVHIDTYGTVKMNEDGVYVEDEGMPEILEFINEHEPDPCNPDPCSSKPSCSTPCESSDPCKPSSDPCDSKPSSTPSEQSYPDISYPSYPDISYPSYPSEPGDSEVTHPSSSIPDISNPDISYPDISYPDISNPDISYPDVSYPDISYPDVSYPDISYPDVSYPDVSYPDISYPSVSYPSVSYPQIVPDGKGSSISTGDNSNKYILVSGVVIVSLSSVFVLVFVGKKKKKR